MNTILNYLDVQTNNIDTLFFDLDRTLLDSNKEISQNCLKMMKKCKSVGYHFGIATGRSLSSITPLLDKYKLYEIFEVIVANSGADIYMLPEMDNINAEHLSRKDVYKIKEIFDGYPDIVIAFHNVNTMCATKRTSFLEKVRKNNNEKNFKLLFENVDFEEPSRVMLEFHEESTLEFILSNPIKGLNGYHSEPEVYEYLKDHVSKSNGIAHYMAQLNKTMEQVICFGDGDNDSEMLNDCKIGVAMKNATNRAIQAADIHWKYSNDEDGVFEFLKCLVREE